jgi:integrase
MAIYLYCPKCKIGSILNSRKCRNCGIPFPKDGKKYRVVVSVDRERSTKVVDNLAIAREVEAAIKADMVRDVYGLTSKKKAPTLGEIWKHYLPWAMENKKSWQADEWNYHRHIEPRFKDKPLDKISPFDLEKLKIELSRATTSTGQNYAKATIKHQLVLLRRLYNLARKWGHYAGSSPFANIEMPKLDNQVTEFLEDEQVARLFKTLDEWPFKDSVAFVKFALFTGLRRGELFKLRWDDVDLDRRFVTLREPKGGKSQTLAISPPAADVLRTLERTSEYCFPGKDGNQRANFRGPWVRIRKAADLPEDFRFHGLRHHFASSLVSKGIDLAIVKELLTHKDIGTTQRYAHLAPSAIRDAVEKSAEILQPQKAARKVTRIRK